MRVPKSQTLFLKSQRIFPKSQTILIERDLILWMSKKNALDERKTKKSF